MSPPKQNATSSKNISPLDKVGFLYEISRSSPKGIDASQRELIALMATRQRAEILRYAELVHIMQVEEFLQAMKL